MAVEVLNVLSTWAIGKLFTIANEVALDMFNAFIKYVSMVYVINLVLKHNLFIHHLKIKIKFLGLDIKVKSKVE